MSSPYFDTEEPIILTISAEYSNMRIDAALAAIIPELSRSRLTNWINLGYILLDGMPCKPKDKIKGGETITITPIISDEKLTNQPENIDLDIIYVDDDIIVINKPAGLTVHPGNGNLSGTLLNGLLYHYPELQYIPRAGIVHRLDKDTTGLMVVARTLLAQTSLVQQLQSRKVSRIYRAIVEGHPKKEGIINKNIGRDLKNRTKMIVLAFGGKEAITRYRVLQYFMCNGQKVSYIECKLETGRTHQIRVHLKSIGHPLLGDPVYGKLKINYTESVVDAITSLNRQALHALKLSFTHPATNEIMKFSVPLATDMKYLLTELEIATALKNNKTNADEHDDNDDNGDGEDNENNWEIIYTNE